jgi:hypothetical protein
MYDPVARVDVDTVRSGLATGIALPSVRISPDGVIASIVTTEPIHEVGSMIDV